jgi:hypothetical protein
MPSKPSAEGARVAPGMRIVQTMEEFEALSAKAMKKMLAARGHDDAIPRGKKELRDMLVAALRSDSSHVHLARLLKERQTAQAEGGAQKKAASSKGKSRCDECAAECDRGMTDSSGTFLCMPCCVTMLKREELERQQPAPSSSRASSSKDALLPQDASSAKPAVCVGPNGAAASDKCSDGGAGRKKRKAAEVGLDEALRSALECPICLETMLPPILQCPAGHSICRVCRTKVSKCPTCRAHLGGIRNLSLEKLVTDQHLTLACTYESRG